MLPSFQSQDISALLLPQGGRELIALKLIVYDKVPYNGLVNFLRTQKSNAI